MNFHQVCQIIGVPLYMFLDNKGLEHFGGFFNMPKRYDASDAALFISGLVACVPIPITLGTHALARSFVATSLPRPPRWCVPASEDGAVMYYQHGCLHTVIIADPGPVWEIRDLCFICIPVGQTLDQTLVM